MTDSTAMVRDSALLLPLAVGIGWGWLGPSAAGAVLASGLVGIGNLWLAGRLVRKLSRAVERGEPGGPVVGLLASKFAVLLGAYALLLWLLDPLAVALGVLVVPAAATVGGLVRAALDDDASETAENP
jgi:hypothetical protein